MKEEEKGFPPYQWSIFPDGNRGEQYVVRAGTIQELETMIGEVKAVISKSAPQQVENMPTADKRAIDEVMAGNTSDELCPVHQVKMFKKTGQYGDFWTHGEKQADGSWKNCNGKGFK